MKIVYNGIIRKLKKQELEEEEKIFNECLKITKKEVVWQNKR